MNFENLTDLIKRNKHLFLLLLLILFSAFFQLYQINRDFNGLFEYDATQFTLHSDNLLKYGLSTKLGPVSNVNPLNGKFTYYLYHPFLSIYIFALFFIRFNDSDRQADLDVFPCLVGNLLVFVGLQALV